MAESTTETPDKTTTAETNTEVVPSTATTETVVTTETPSTTEATTTTETKPVVEDENLMDEFQAAKEAPLKVADKKASVKKEESLEIKKEETTKTDDKTKVGDTTQPTTGARDYTGVPENVVPLLKKMSNDAFNFFKPFYIEAEGNKKKVDELTKQITESKKGGIPETYYEHPEAVVLTPEFQLAAKDTQDAGLVFQHWEQQLQAVRQGATEYTTLVKDPKTGELALGPKKPADATAETTLLRYFTWAQNQLAQKQGKLESVKESYATKYQESSNAFKQLEDAWFPAFKDGKHALIPIVQDTLNQLPAAYRKNPLATALAKALTSTLQLGRQLKSIQETGKKLDGTPFVIGGGSKTTVATITVGDKKETAKEDTRKAGPTTTSAATGKVAEPDVTMEDFEAVKNT